MSRRVRDPEAGVVYDFPDNASDEEILKFISAQKIERGLTLVAPSTPRSGSVEPPPPEGGAGRPIFPEGAPPVSDLLPPAGAVVGGIAGTAAGGVPGAMVGAGMGGALGEAVRRYIQGETPDMSQVATTGILSGLTEGAGAGLNALIRKGAAPFAKGYNMPASQKFRQIAQREDILTSPAEETGSQALSQIEAFPFRMPFGSSRMIEAKRQELASMERAGNVMAYGGSAPAPSVRGAGTQADLKAAEAAARAKGRGFYRDVARLAGDQEFQVPSFRSAIDASMERMRKLGGLGPSQERSMAAAGNRATTNPDYQRAADALGAQTGLGPGDPLIQQLANLGIMPDRGLNYETAHEFQSLLGQEIRKTTSDYARFRLKELRDALTSDINTWADAQDGPLKRAIGDAAKYYREEIGGVFDEKSMVRQMLKADPSQVMSMVRTATDAQKFRQALDHVASSRPGALEEARRSFIQNVVDRSVDPQTQEFMPGKFVAQLSKYTPDAREAMLGSEQAARINDIAEVFRRQVEMSRSGINPSQTARGVLGAQQIYGVVRFGLGAAAGVATGFAAGGPPGGLVAGGAVLLTPAMISRLLTSDTGQQWLTRGLTVPAGTKEAIRVASQLALHATLQSTETSDGTRRLIMKPDEVLTGTGR